MFSFHVVDLRTLPSPQDGVMLSIIWSARNNLVILMYTTKAYILPLHRLVRYGE